MSLPNSSVAAISLATVAAAAVVSSIFVFKLFHNNHSEKRAVLSDRDFLKLCAERMQRVEPPRQSKFRVYAILTWENVDDSGEKRLGWVSGTNSESAFIGGSLCAERAAAVQLRELPRGTRVTGVYLVSDLEQSCITPGVLCREYLLSCVHPDTPIHLGSKDLHITRVTSLRKLYPCRSVYESMPRDSIAERGKKTAAKIELETLFKGPNGKVWKLLMEKACSSVQKDIFGAQMHPVQYATAMQFADGSVSVAWQKAGLEYGTSIDSVTALLHEVDAKGSPLRLIQVDNYGVLHAPFAPARAQLFERGCQATEVAVYDIDKDKLVVTSIKDLVPDCPSMGELWPSCCRISDVH